MLERVANVFVDALLLYAAIGGLFSVAFVWRGISKVDSQARGSGILFRLLVFPGAAAFWPLLTRRWLHASGEPAEEGNPHR